MQSILISAMLQSRQGADIYKVHVPSRKVIQLTTQERTPNTGAVPAGTESHPRGVHNLAPCPVAGGKVVFVSDRNGFRGVREQTQPALQLFVMEDDGSNVELIGPLNLGKSRDEARSLALECLARVELAEAAERPPHHLSFGERKRVCLAGVLACEPSILVLDEPTANLDPRGRRRFIELIRDKDEDIRRAAEDDGAEAVPFGLEQGAIEIGDLVGDFRQHRLDRRIDRVGAGRPEWRLVVWGCVSGGQAVASSSAAICACGLAPRRSKSTKRYSVSPTRRLSPRAISIIGSLGEYSIGET